MSYKLSFVMDSGEDKEFAVASRKEAEGRVDTARRTGGFWFAVDRQTESFYPYRRVLYATITSPPDATVAGVPYHLAARPPVRDAGPTIPPPVQEALRRIVEDRYGFSHEHTPMADIATVLSHMSAEVWTDG